MDKRFGNLTTVSVREYWKNEQFDFTPWLAQEDHIAQLSDALGIELEVENIEVAVGPYSADILAKDTGTDRYVVIENQFGRTNHDHLGKLITYGSVLDASAVVWLSENFTEEHRRALDWLNDNTSDELAFYGVTLELWQIDNSRPALRFNVVSEPPAPERKRAAGKVAETLTEGRQLQLDFWTEFRNRLLAAQVVRKAQTPRPQYWFDVTLGRAGIHLSNTASTTRNRVGVRVYLSSKVADVALAHLQKERTAIEREIGETLQWNPSPDNRDKIILLDRPADLADRDKWPEYCDWLVDMNGRFRKAFAPRVKNLDLTAPIKNAEDDVA